MTDGFSISFNQQEIDFMQVKNRLEKYSMAPDVKQTAQNAVLERLRHKTNGSKTEICFKEKINFGKIELGEVVLDLFKKNYDSIKQTKNLRCCDFAELLAHKLPKVGAVKLTTFGFQNEKKEYPVVQKNYFGSKVIVFFHRDPLQIRGIKLLTVKQIKTDHSPKERQTIAGNLRHQNKEKFKALHG